MTWCDICKKNFHPLGYARHRTMHYDNLKRGLEKVIDKISQGDEE